MTHQDIENFLIEAAEKSKQQVTAEGKPEDIDFGPLIKGWASEYGFSAAEARHEIDKWIDEVEQNESDITKLGLAAFGRKNFAKAADLFRKAAETKEKRLKDTRERQQQLEEKEKTLTEEVIRDYRLEGDAHYNNYQFESALLAYQNAIEYVSKNDDQQLWYGLTIEIGKTNYQIGIRTRGTDIHSYLNTAVEAYQMALEVYTRETLPQQWAMTQDNLGLVLQNLGRRTAAEAGNTYLTQAVEAYQKALKVYTRATLPQDWARSQDNLGNVLYELGIRTGGNYIYHAMVEAFGWTRAGQPTE